MKVRNGLFLFIVFICHVFFDKCADSEIGFSADKDAVFEESYFSFYQKKDGWYDFFLYDHKFWQIAKLYTFFLNEDFSIIEIAIFEVDESFRGKGYGKEALQVFEIYIRTFYPKVKKIYLQSVQDAVQFYEKCGYQNKGANELELINMEKILIK